jgi:hypothetical protein
MGAPCALSCLSNAPLNLRSQIKTFSKTQQGTRQRSERFTRRGEQSERTLRPALPQA